MVSESNLSSDGRALKWAAAQLGVPPESSPEVCTTAFLRRLAEEDFVPPPRLKDAWQFVTRGSSDSRPALPWIDSDAESELSGRIEEFAGQFFNLPPEQRSAHWERLYAEAQQWPRLETRLRRLKPGLTIEFKPLPTLSLREAKLIQWIRELFPLPMEERAVRRRQMLRDDVRTDIQPWQKAAQRVARRQPTIAALRRSASAAGHLEPERKSGLAQSTTAQRSRRQVVAAARSLRTRFIQTGPLALGGDRARHRFGKVSVRHFTGTTAL